MILGGSINDDVRKMDLYTPALDHKTILRQAAFVQGQPPKSFLAETIDFIPRNHIGFYQYHPVYTSEEALHNSLIQSVTGHGARRDHPVVQRSVYESLKHEPKLLQAYLHA